MNTFSPLTFTHLRFDCRALEPLRLNNHRAGDYLRNALAEVMLHAVCPENNRREKPTPEHAAVCPVCWLLAHEAKPGRVHRAYALVPPLPPRDVVSPRAGFSFGLTMFGETGFEFLPYLVLAVTEAGRVGVGPGRGRFALEAIWAANPLAGEAEQVLVPGENLVRVPETAVGWANVEAVMFWWGAERNQETVKIRFLAPTRLVAGKKLVKAPDFGVLFRRLLKRIDELGGQFAGAARRPQEEVQHLHALADQVRLVEVGTRWVDLKSWSGRTRRHTPMGGFVGTARYRSDAWERLLPYLILGQGTQVGKLAVKGNGVFEVAWPDGEGYWAWVDSAPEVLARTASPKEHLSGQRGPARTANPEQQ
ncbi:MAG: CRISPR system precrRNA processing endoribonuclease RAMP protein Cas6 [Anaerolineales bacterium]